MKPTAYSPRRSRQFFELTDALAAQTRAQRDALRVNGLAVLHINRLSNLMREPDLRGVIHPLTWEYTATAWEELTSPSGEVQARTVPIPELWVPEWAARVIHTLANELARGPRHAHDERWLPAIREVLGFVRDDLELRAAVCAFLDVCDQRDAGPALMELFVLHDCRRRGLVAWPKPSAMSWPHVLGAAPPFWLYLARRPQEVA